MKRRSRFSSLLLILAATLAPSARVAHGAHINVIELDNQIISPVTARYIDAAIARSETDGAVCLVIMLDTPGGLLESTRSIVKRIMNSAVPIAVYVAPAGSRAGSAGLFITLAAHVAAMAPSTNIGAAHPIDFGGMGDNPIKKISKEIDKDAPEGKKGEGEKKEEKPAQEESRSPMEEKILNDTVAWVTGIARARGRNEQWAEKAVTESFSVPAEEAVKEHVVDFIAVDLKDLLAKMNGRAVKVENNELTLNTEGASVVRIPMTPLQKFLATITNPNIAYLLMMLGTLGLIFEFTHPGLAFPGVAGFVCLLLALYAFQVLPVNYVAIALLALGVALFVAEVTVVSHGLLAVGGAVCFTLGSLMLFESPGSTIRVSLTVILPAVATVGGITLLLLNRVVRSRAIPVATGAQGIVGEIGEASTDLNPEGLVFVHGETWKAASHAPIGKGAKVRVAKVRGLSLEVEPQEAKKHNIKGER